MWEFLADAPSHFHYYTDTEMFSAEERRSSCSVWTSTMQSGMGCLKIGNCGTGFTLAIGLLTALWHQLLGEGILAGTRNHITVFGFSLPVTLFMVWFSTSSLVLAVFNQTGEHILWVAKTELWTICNLDPPRNQPRWGLSRTQFLPLIFSATLVKWYLYEIKDNP